MLKEYSWVFFCMLCALSALDAEHRLEPRRTKRIQREIQGNEWIGEVPTFADFTIDIYIGMTASYLPPNPFQPFTSHQGKIGEAMVRRYSVIPRAQRFSAIDQSTYVTAPQSGNNNYRSVGGVSRHVTFDRPAQINRDTTTQPVPTPHYELSDDPSFLSSVRYQHEIGLVYRARSTTEDPLRGPTDIKYSHTKNSETHKLNEGAEAARIAQRTWLESIRRQKNLQEETRRQYLQEAREAQEQKANEERRARHEAQEQRLLARRAIIAAQVERQRVENEAREQRILAQRAVIAAAAERRRIELEERQRVENEAREQRKLAQRAIIAAAAERHRIELEERQRVENEVRERQRLLGEEAERLRRERERECVVCLESNDIGIMVQTPCAHWYCRIHLRGMSRSTILGSITLICNRRVRGCLQLQSALSMLSTSRSFRRIVGLAHSRLPRSIRLLAA